jgi:hypothetical protein
MAITGISAGNLNEMASERRKVDKPKIMEVEH